MIPSYDHDNRIVNKHKPHTGIIKNKAVVDASSNKPSNIPSNATSTGHDIPIDKRGAPSNDPSHVLRTYVEVV